MKRPNLTAAEKDFIAEKRELGWSCERIARAVGCSIGSVSWCCLKLGADPPKAKPLSASIRGPMTMMRNGHAVRRFGPGEDRAIMVLTQQGHSPTQIGRALGRQANSIVGRLMTLARRENRMQR